MKQLVFIHGRSQQNLDSANLKQEWINALRTGLAKGGKQLPIDDVNIRFPYYGDTLDQMCKGMTPEEAAKVIVRGEISDDAERAFAALMITEAAKQFGITEEQAAAEMDLEVIRKGIENWPIVLGFLRALEKVPGVNTEAIALATHDVYQYLTQSGISLVINQGVMQAFTPGIETVIVSHSLGTVIAYNVLRAPGTGWKVTHLITLGSPLAITPIKQALAPLGRPGAIGRWFNARDPHDVVALFPLTARYFPPQPIDNKDDVDNFTSNKHGIAGYLSDMEVAKYIYDALV